MGVINVVIVQLICFHFANFIESATMTVVSLLGLIDK